MNEHEYFISELAECELFEYKGGCEFKVKGTYLGFDVFYSETRGVFIEWFEANEFFCHWISSSTAFDILPEELKIKFAYHLDLFV